MINYFFEEIDKVEIHSKTSEWLKNLIQTENKKLGEINYIFCDDDYLLKVNQDYLDHDYYTDIITFDISGKGEPVSGEIYISADRVKDNAAQLRTTISNEIHRVIFHGVLHLCGYKDKTRVQQKQMRLKENQYLMKYFE